MIAGDTVPVQAEEPIVSASTEEYFIQVPTDRALVVKPTLGVATQEAATISTSEALVVTSEMRQLMVQLAPVLLGETSASPPPSESTITTIVETRGSALPASAPVIDIMEELTLQIIEQFLWDEVLHQTGTLWMKSLRVCTLLIENQIKYIKQTGRSDWAKVYQVLV